VMPRLVEFEYTTDVPLPRVVEYEFAPDIAMPRVVLYEFYTDTAVPRLVSFEFMGRVYEVEVRVVGADAPYWVDGAGPYYGANRFLWDRGTTHRLRAVGFAACEDSTECFTRFLYWVSASGETVREPEWATYVSESTYIEGHFEVVPTYHYVIGSDPAGRRFYVDGVTCSTAVDRYWWSGSEHRVWTDTLQVNSDSTEIYHFVGWVVGGETLRVADTVISSEMNDTVVCVFMTDVFYRHVVTTRPRVRPVYVDGDTFMPPRTYTWERGTSHIIGTDSIQVAADSSEYYYFVGWELSEGGSAIDTLHTREISVSPTSAIDYTGIFVVWPYYRHTISTSPAVLPVRVDGVENNATCDIQVA